MQLALYSIIVLSLLTYAQCQQVETEQVLYDLIEPGIVDHPIEVTGVFIGQDRRTAVGVIDYCTLVITRPEGGMTWISQVGNCEDKQNTTIFDFVKDVDIEQILIGENYNSSCTGFGEGELYYVEIQIGYVCMKFKRQDNIIDITYGGYVNSTEEVVCPPSATADPETDPLTLGKVQFEASDKFSRSIAPDQYTCQ